METESGAPRRPVFFLNQRERWELSLRPDDRGTWVSGNCNANFSIDQDYRDNSGDYQQR